MINFFRKIRQKTPSENIFSKYFIYAVVEIVLVVTGILISLQINKAKEFCKSHLELVKISQNLIQEFESNQKTLNTARLELKKKNFQMS